MQNDYLRRFREVIFMSQMSQVMSQSAVFRLRLGLGFYKIRVGVCLVLGSGLGLGWAFVGGLVLGMVFGLVMVRFFLFVCGFLVLVWFLVVLVLGCGWFWCWFVVWVGLGFSVRFGVNYVFSQVTHSLKLPSRCALQVSIF